MCVWMLIKGHAVRVCTKYSPLRKSTKVLSAGSTASSRVAQHGDPQELGVSEIRLQQREFRKEKPPCAFRSKKTGDLGERKIKSVGGRPSNDAIVCS